MAIAAGPEFDDDGIRERPGDWPGGGVGLAGLVGEYTEPLVVEQDMHLIGPGGGEAAPAQVEALRGGWCGEAEDGGVADGPAGGLEGEKAAIQLPDGIGIGHAEEGPEGG